MQWPMSGRQKDGRETKAFDRPPCALFLPDRYRHLRVRHPRPVTETAPRNSHGGNKGSPRFSWDPSRRFRLSRGSGRGQWPGEGRGESGRPVGRVRTAEGKRGPGASRPAALPPLRAISPARATPGAGLPPSANPS